MSLIFFGTPLFAVPALRALADSGESISLVVTQPDRPKGRGHQTLPTPVKQEAIRLGIDVIQPPRIRDETFVNHLSSLEPEFIAVVAYGLILPESILSIPGFGCINVHASLLPRYRGAAPIQRALLEGEIMTGVTTMLMGKGLDTGPILLQAALPILHEDTTASLSSRLSDAGSSLLVETLRGIRNNTVSPVPQTGEASYAPPLTKEEGKINWNKDAVSLACFVRGMQPWPSAYCRFGEEGVKVLSAEPEEGSAAPGVISSLVADGIRVGTGKGLLRIEIVQPDGKKPMSARAFCAGRKVRPGHDRFS